MVGKINGFVACDEGLVIAFALVFSLSGFHVVIWDFSCVNFLSFKVYRGYCYL